MSDTIEDRRQYTDADVDELLQRTCTDRGLPVVIDDPVTIAKVATILAGAGGDAG